MLRTKTFSGARRLMATIYRYQWSFWPIAAISAISIVSCIQSPTTEVAPAAVPASPPSATTATKTEGPESTVVASFYSDSLANQKTASGEPYKPEELTAAHKTLPLGTVVEVKNPENGKSVEVKINDRGPFVKGRSIDLSRAAAEKVGLKKKGVAKLKLRKVKPAPTDADHGASAKPVVTPRVR